MSNHIVNSNQPETAPDSARRDALRALHGKVCGDLRSRQAWLNKQAAWYQMRHDGLRRKHKLFPQAADLECELLIDRQNAAARPGGRTFPSARPSRMFRA